MKNQTVSTAAFIGAGLMIVLFIFKVTTVKQTLLGAAGLGAIGFITQPIQPATTFS